MSSAFAWCDRLGPARVLEIFEPALDLKAVVVIDNVATGPAIGGVRMAADATAHEAFRLARAMTWKNAAAELPHGGAKSVVIADPRRPEAERETLMRAFARAIAPLTDYIPGPDMGTDERAMAWVHDEIGRSVGLPRPLGGIPLDEIGATGLGLTVAAAVAAEEAGFALEGARFVVEGFGAVGRHAARFLVERGAVMVGVADTGGAAIDKNGLDLERLLARKAEGASVAEAGAPPAGALIEVPCEIWIPAARPDVIHEGNADRLKARIVAPGANIAVTEAAEAMLHRRGVLVLPDFIANAGGVICAAVEHRGGSEADALKTIEEKIGRNTRLTLEAAAKERLDPRAAATRLAEARIEAAMQLRRFHA